MKTLSNSASSGKGTASMRKKMLVFLAIGILCLISGLIMAILHVTPEIIPVWMMTIGFLSIFGWIYTKGGALIPDEMVKRTDALSGNYSFIASFYFILALCAINLFHPFSLRINELLVTILLFMSLSFFFIRFYLLKRGKAE